MRHKREQSSQNHFSLLNFFSSFIALLFTSFHFMSDGHAHEAPVNNHFLFDLECLTESRVNFYESYKKIGFYDFASFNSYDLFLNLNGFLIEDRIKGLSTGLGVRKSYKEGIFGFNIYHDFQSDSTDLNQIGVGIEFFNERFIFYGNAYLPLGDKSFGSNTVIFDDYIGDYIVYCMQRNLRGSGFELNLLTAISFREAVRSYLSMGVYGVRFHKCDKAFGVRGGFRFDISEKIHIEPQCNYDKLYGTNFGVKFEVVVPLTDALGLRYRPVSRKFGLNYEKRCKYQTNY